MRTNSSPGPQGEPSDIQIRTHRRVHLTRGQPPSRNPLVDPKCNGNSVEILKKKSSSILFDASFISMSFFPLLINTYLQYFFYKISHFLYPSPKKIMGT